MSAPEESTRGGLFGLQHRDVPQSLGDGDCRCCHSRWRTEAELRSYALVTELYQERFQRPPAFTEAEYGGFLAKATPILTAFSLDLKLVNELPKRASEIPAPRSRRRSRLRRSGAHGDVGAFRRCGGRHWRRWPSLGASRLRSRRRSVVEHCCDRTRERFGCAEAHVAGQGSSVSARGRRSIRALHGAGEREETPSSR